MKKFLNIKSDSDMSNEISNEKKSFLKSPLFWLGIVLILVGFLPGTGLGFFLFWLTMTLGASFLVSCFVINFKKIRDPKKSIFVVLRIFLIIASVLSLAGTILSGYAAKFDSLAGLGILFYGIAFVISLFLLVLLRILESFLKRRQDKKED